jgi:outer membrane protein assembly factor BamB
MASISACVSANGRVFTIQDEGSTVSIRLPARWSLVARDAAAGVLLWKRPITEWNTWMWPLKSGPAALPRRLVAVGNEVYVTLGLSEAVSVLDAASGETLRTFDATRAAEEMILSGGVLFTVSASPEDAARRNQYVQKHTFVWGNSNAANNGWAWDESERRVVAIEAATGRVLWQRHISVAPMTLAADADRVYLHDGESVAALSRSRGELLWRSEPVSRRKVIPTGFNPTLVVQQGVVLFSGGDRKMCGVNAATGKVVWTAAHPPSGHMSPEDLLVVGGLAWAGDIANGADSGVFTGRDLRTGEVKAQFPPDVKAYWFHHRCYRSKATDRYLLPSRTGIEFVDFKAQRWETHHWVRGGCLYGIMPANGLVYVPPHSCGCYIESKLFGFSALAPASAQADPVAAPESRMERGPAYAQTPAPPARPDDWPTYRHDAARSGATAAAVGAGLAEGWRADLGGRLTSVVAADGRLLVAQADAHTVHALDAATGQPLWRFTAGGRVDSPPTLYNGRALFGSADGWVYALRASDGALAWRFRAAPADRQIVAWDQVESAWPVHGSVLVLDGVVYATAGRSMFLDGGIRLVRLDAETGRFIGEKVLDDRDPAADRNLQGYVQGLNMPTALPDVLSSDGRYLYMRSQRMDLEGNRFDLEPRKPTEQTGEGTHIFSTIGFLDDSWFHRSLWVYGRTATGGYGGWYQPGRYAPAGRMLVCDDATVYGYGRQPEFFVNGSVLEYRLFAAPRETSAEAIERARKAAGRINAAGKQKNADGSDWKLRQSFPLTERAAPQPRWAVDRPPLLVRAMALAGRTLLVAGPPDLVDEQAAFEKPDDPAQQAALAAQDAALRGEKGALLWAVSADDGRRLAEIRLDAPPVFDGLIVAGGRVYVATESGQVVCIEEKTAKAAE